MITVEISDHIDITYFSPEYLQLFVDIPEEDSAFITGVEMIK